MKYLILFIMLFSGAYSADINLHIKGLENSEGQVIVYLYDNEDDFPTKAKNAVKTIFKKIDNKQSHVTIKGIDKGKYAIAVVHDEDNDSELDRNFIGMPSEDVAASNNAKGSFGPPSFEDAAFDVGEKNIDLLIDFSK